MTTVTLSLVSHTNAGKTTLARTLTGRDVGEVRDAPHVTQDASAHTLVESAQGDALVLWDTPGFGDSARLAKRLALEGNPVGWFLTQVWDRFRDRAFFLTQRAVRNVREEADVVLYLVNAAEDPADAGYLDPELAILAWMQKPVLMLLNQTGPAHEEDDVARWRRALVSHPHVRDVIAFDAFARCWVQEFALLDAIGDAVAQDKRDAFARLSAAWDARRAAQLDASMAALARVVTTAACARVVVPRPAMLRRIGSALGIGEGDAKAEETRAAKTLASDVSARMDEAMQVLIAEHGLSGRAAAEVEAHLAQDIARDGPVDEGKAAAMGGVLSGAMTGLAADLAAGGLTFGAGMLTGAVLGALGGAGIARAFNVARGQTDETIRFDDAFVVRLCADVLLRYLAVAHYGRGRGAFVERDAPADWRARIESAMAAKDDQLAAILAARVDGDPDAIMEACTVYLREVALHVLDDLYPGALASRAAFEGSVKAMAKAQSAFRLRVTRGEDIALGPGKVALLEAIGREGSITAAAKTLGMSYRRAWLLVDTMNRNFVTPVVEAGAGGTHGGGAALTPVGRDVVERYRRIEATAARAAAADIRGLAALLRK